ncbi:MAG: DUF1207 domain-containing protein [Pirellulales bacterium]
MGAFHHKLKNVARSRLILAVASCWIVAGFCAPAGAQATAFPNSIALAELPDDLSGPVRARLPGLIEAAPFPVGPGSYDGPWTWQFLPQEILYPSYLAGPKEPRFATNWFHERRLGWLWDATLGARAGVARYGTQDNHWPEGWQLDIEGAAFPRLNVDGNRDLVSADFRFGVPLTYREGPWAAKFAYYHLSSHLGDEFLLRNREVTRINFTRDALVLGGAYYWTEDVRLYAETGWAFANGGGSEPWEFQFGAEYSPAYNMRPIGSPFVAINAHLREEVNFGGSLAIQTGWQWRGTNSSRLFRVGVQYLTGPTEAYEFLGQSEQQIGIAAWYDF